MNLSMFKKISLLFTFLFCINTTANAAQITTDFSELLGNQGSVDIHLSLANGEVMNGLSVYFSEALFADLAIESSPLEWDSIVLQPDALLGAGLFDSYNIDGLISGFARISFSWISNLPFDSALQTLDFEFYNADFEFIEAGVSTPVVASVPESSTLMLLMIGLLMLGLHRQLRNSLTIFPSRAH